MTNTDLTKQLVISVDTEEEGLWGGEFPITNCTTENLRGLERFQATCESLGVGPTYLIDAPVLHDRRAVADLKKWQNAGLCEVGAHCHPWCNPPIVTETCSSAESYLCNLPEELQREKLEWLTRHIAETFDRSPTSYRAGRYGFDGTSAEILDDLGYVVDSSILPLHDYRREGGPSFVSSQREPFRYFRDGRQLIELPITAGFTKSRYSFRRSLWVASRKPVWKQFRIAGVLDRLGIARRVKLCPEGTTTRELLELVDASVEDGLSTIVLMLHSSSFVAGHSPYTPSAEKVDLLFDRLRDVIIRAIEKHNFAPATLTDAARSLAASSNSF